MPFIAVWPFLSTLPLIALAAPPVEWTKILLQLTFLVTGFWGLLAAYLGLNFLMSNGIELPSRRNMRPVGAFYILAWTGGYAVCRFSNSM